MSREALEIFLAYHWPGNVRELINVIDYSFVLCKEGVIQPEHLPSQMSGKRPPRPEPGAPRLPAPSGLLGKNC